MRYLIFVFLATGCASKSTATRPEPRRMTVSEAALYYVDHAPKGARDDCSGFALAALERAGIRLTGNTESLWRLAEERKLTHAKKTPREGDLAFFDNTYDRNNNRRLDDELTHVGVVVAVADDGTIHIAHNGTSKGRSVMRMNLYDPDAASKDGRILNDFLRGRSSRDKRRTKYLAGELWRGFARFEP